MERELRQKTGEKMGEGALKRRKTVTSIQIALCGLRPQRAICMDLDFENITRISR